MRELAAAADGLPLVVVGDGPLRSLFPQRDRLRPARRSSVRTTSGRRSSSSRPGARATGWSPARRWRTGGPSWRPRSAGWSTRSRTASPGSSCPGGTPRRFATALERLLADAALRRARARAAAACAGRALLAWRVRPAALRADSTRRRAIRVVRRRGSAAASAAPVAHRSPSASCLPRASAPRR